MKTTWLILLVLILALVSAIPKKGGGGFSHSHSKPDFSGANKVFKATSTVKAKNFKNVKKVALVAAGAYAGYQLAKLGTKFGSWSHGGSWGFDDWDDWREADGMLCRTSDDCRWVDRSMRCEDWEIRRTGFSSGWFGGVPTLAIRGECACPEGTFFDDDDMACNDVPPFGFGLLTIIGIIIAVIVTACCCVCCCFGKKLFQYLKTRTTDTQ